MKNGRGINWFGAWSKEVWKNDNRNSRRRKIIQTGYETKSDKNSGIPASIW